MRGNLSVPGLLFWGHSWEWALDGADACLWLGRFGSLWAARNGNNWDILWNKRVQNMRFGMLRVAASTVPAWLKIIMVRSERWRVLHKIEFKLACPEVVLQDRSRWARQNMLLQVASGNWCVRQTKVLIRESVQSNLVLWYSRIHIGRLGCSTTLNFRLKLSPELQELVSLQLEVQVHLWKVRVILKDLGLAKKKRVLAQAGPKLAKLRISLSFFHEIRIKLGIICILLNFKSTIRRISPTMLLENNPGEGCWI